MLRLPRYALPILVRFRLISVVSGLALWCILSFGSVPQADAESRTRVFLNGTPISVYFNDGDTYRMFSGPYSGTSGRLAGFNTLESYGPVHQWGDWHPYELWIMAKRATYNARRGVWHCETDGARDGYGRVLIECPDLVVDQLRKGFAHAMQIDDTVARPEYIRAQQEAMRARRGIWAKGIPDFVLTSIHSAAEDRTRDETYNRLVSTRDGHTQKMIHRDVYDECEVICNTERHADQEKVAAFARALRADAAVAPVIAELSNLNLIEIVDRYARLAEIPEWTTDAVRSAVEPALAEARRAGTLGEVTEREGACMMYVTFERWFEPNRAQCLRGRGTFER